MANKRAPKADDYREVRVESRFSQKEFDLLEKLQAKRKQIRHPRWSRTDVIVDALRFADGQIIFD